MNHNLSAKLGLFSFVEANNVIILKPSELKDAKIPSNHHLYMIIGITRTLISGCKYTDSPNPDLLVEVETNSGDKIELTIEIPEVIRSLEVSSDKRKLYINDEEFLISDLLFKVNRQVLGEILYIGQAKGNKESRNTGKRLINHETLQKILADIIDSKLDFDIRLISFSVKEDLMWTNLTTESTSNAELSDIYDISSHSFQIKIQESDFINLVEAKLINYFKPAYNDRFTQGKVPSNKHTSYRQYLILFNDMSINLYKLSKFVFKKNGQFFFPQKDIIKYAINETEYIDLIDRCIV